MTAASRPFARAECTRPDAMPPMNSDTAPRENPYAAPTVQAALAKPPIIASADKPVFHGKGNPFLDAANAAEANRDTLLSRAATHAPSEASGIVRYVWPWWNVAIGQIQGYELHIPDGNYCVRVTLDNPGAALIAAHLHPPLAGPDDKRRGEWHVTWQELAGMRNETVTPLSVEEINPMVSSYQTVPEKLAEIARAREAADAKAAAPTGPSELDAVFGPKAAPANDLHAELNAQAAAEADKPYTPSKRPTDNQGAKAYIPKHLAKRYTDVVAVMKAMFGGALVSEFVNEFGFASAYEHLDAYERAHPYDKPDAPPYPYDAESAPTVQRTPETPATPPKPPTGNLTPATAEPPAGGLVASVETTKEPAVDKPASMDTVTGEIVDEKPIDLQPEPTKEIALFDPNIALAHVMSTSDLINAMIKRDLLMESHKDTKGNEVDGDYGKIAGSKKPALFKSGAEKLCEAFGLRPEFELLSDSISDWNTPFFYFHYKCKLYRISTGELIATANGSCNSKEDKYGWRWVELDKIPRSYREHLQDLETRTGKIGEYGFALNKAETTGKYGKPEAYWQEFKDAIASGKAIKSTRDTQRGQSDYWEIETTMYRIPNADIFSIVNTLDKMSQKRSLIAATLIGTAASRFFTQDIEDLAEYGMVA